MRTLSKTLLAFILIVAFAACSKEEMLLQNSSNDELSVATQAVEDDILKGEDDISSKDKGDKNYCEALEQKMKTLEKESVEMEKAWKLYKMKCHKCSGKEGKDWDKVKGKDRDKGDYCNSLKQKLNEFEKGSKEHQEILELIEKKCNVKEKDKEPK